MSAPARPPDAGCVHLVGAGPGDPLLLTRRAADLLGRADVVVADRPSSAALTALAPAAAERCYVGRHAEGPAWPLAAVVDLLEVRARAGQLVVRLKSGDPFVCSRGAEELAALLERGVPTRVVPGVTAATAAPLAAGCPRGRTVTVVAGNVDPVQVPVHWERLADPTASLVVLIGRSRHTAIAACLGAGGLPADTPAVVVGGAARRGQRVLHTSVAQLGDQRLPPPATIVIGPRPADGDRPADGRRSRGSAGAHP